MPARPLHGAQQLRSPPKGPRPRPWALPAAPMPAAPHTRGPAWPSAARAQGSAREELADTRRATRPRQTPGSGPAPPEERPEPPHGGGRRRARTAAEGPRARRRPCGAPPEEDHSAAVPDVPQQERHPATGPGLPPLRRESHRSPPSPTLQDGGHISACEPSSPSAPPANHTAPAPPRAFAIGRCARFGLSLAVSSLSVTQSERCYGLKRGWGWAVDFLLASRRTRRAHFSSHLPDLATGERHRDRRFHCPIGRAKAS